jgi:hypothetical protein
MSGVFSPSKAAQKLKEEMRFQSQLAQGRKRAEKKMFERELQDSLSLRRRQNLLTSGAGVPDDEDLLGGAPFDLRAKRMKKENES